MRRFFQHRCLRLLAFRTVANSGTNASAPASESSHPIFFNAPVVSRTLGRDMELLSLWQNLLSGRHVQVISGPDGIGKSTLAAEFCDRVRRSERFTCIQWFDAKDASRTNLVHFFCSMQGRLEKDVLLVIDDAEDPQEVINLIPEHANVYTLITTTTTATTTPVESSARMSVQKLIPLPASTVEQFPQLVGVEYSIAVKDVFFALGYVPLLMHVASSLMENGFTSPQELSRLLDTKGIDGKGVLSVSHSLGVLLDHALMVLEREYPGGTRVLIMVAFLSIRSVSYAILDRLVNDDSGGEAFAMQAAGLGICDQSWDEGSLTMHPSIARILRSKADATCVAECTKTLLSMWPRRWRGAGSSVAHELMRHTRAICEGSDAHQIPLNDDALVCLDRSATLLAFNEGKDLSTAAELWLRVVRANQEAEKRDAEAVRIGRECGRLLHFLRDNRAGAVLQYAFELVCAVKGKQSAEAALILGCYAPYIPASSDALRTLQTGVVALEGRMASVDTVRGREEERMLQETIFVLLVRQGQMLKEMNETVPASLWVSLQEVEERMKKGQPPVQQ